MTKNQKRIALVAGVVALLAVTAGASAYVAKEIDNNPPNAKASDEITWNNERQQPQPQQQAKAEPACDDANVVGAAIGAVAGGVVGNQVGSGKGQDLATIGGAIGGGYLGQQHIPTRNVLCP